MVELASLGFFSQQDLDDAYARYLEEFGDADLGIGGVELDQVTLAFDTSRVWHRDCECDAMEGNREWERWAVGLARVAGFSDASAEERWLPIDAGKPRVELTLSAGGRTSGVLGHDFGDYIDSDAITRCVNQLLPRRGPRVRSAHQSGQSAYLVMLTNREKAALVLRGWRFHEDDRPRPGTSRFSRGFGVVRSAWNDFWWPFKG